MHQSKMLGSTYNPLNRVEGCDPYHNRRTNRYGTVNPPTKAQKRTRRALKKRNRQREKGFEDY